MMHFFFAGKRQEVHVAIGQLKAAGHGGRLHVQAAHVRHLRTYSSHVFTNPEFSICNCFLEKFFCLFHKNNSYIGISYSILIL